MTELYLWRDGINHENLGYVRDLQLLSFEKVDFYKISKWILKINFPCSKSPTRHSINLTIIGK